MGVIDILTRVDAICHKYERYDADMLNGAGVAGGDDLFARLFASVDAEVNECLEKAEAARKEKNRATVVALNLEIRRTKAKLVQEDLPKLQRLALGKVKGLSKEELAIRSDLIGSSQYQIEVLHLQRKLEYRDPVQEARFSLSRHLDEDLDIIGEGVETLKNIVSDMNKADGANTDLKNTNNRLKETVLQIVGPKYAFLSPHLYDPLRSNRNFCIDIVLLCVILGIAAYLYW
uniref:t-SNARE coiled-coil homology domain-containing protein n=1 Tax=Leersia perrieri TaxID=77586 RepID=A0A0D9V482_9ORYZ